MKIRIRFCKMVVVKLVLIAIFVVILPIGCEQPQRSTKLSRFQFIEAISSSGGTRSDLYEDSITGDTYIRTKKGSNAFNSDTVTWTKL